MHIFFSFSPIAKDSFLVKCTMQGARRHLGDSTLSADPLFPEDLVRIYKTLNYRDIKDLVFWTALCLGYRCLLHKGHFTSSPHNMARSQLTFTEYGLSLRIDSSKTIQFHERNVVVTVIESPGSVLYPVKWLGIYLARLKVPESGPLFVMLDDVSKPISYQFFSTRLSKSLKFAG